MAANPTLLGIPPELFERVAQHADKVSLRALRLTNHECNTNVFRTFAQEHFSILRIILVSEESLTKALDVCKHPIYARFIETVKIYTEEFMPPNVFQHMQKAEGLNATRDEELYDRQKELRGQNRDLLLLTAIFSRLAGRSRELKEVRIARASNSDGAEDLIPGALLEGVIKDPRAPWKLIMEAMDVSGIHVKSLVTDSTGSCFDILADVDDKYQASLDGAMSHLESLKLDIGVFGYTSATPLTKCLAKATQLKHFELNVHYMPWMYSDQPQHFDAGLWTLEIPSLETIHLSGFHMPLPQLMALLRRHKNLEIAILSDMHLSECGELVEKLDQELFHEAMRKTTSFKRYALHYVYFHDGAVPVDQRGFRLKP